MLKKSDSPFIRSVDCRRLIVLLALALPGAGVHAAVLSSPSLPDLIPSSGIFSPADFLNSRPGADTASAMIPNRAAGQLNDAAATTVTSCSPAVSFPSGLPLPDRSGLTELGLMDYGALSPHVPSAAVASALSSSLLPATCEPWNRHALTDGCYLAVADVDSLNQPDSGAGKTVQAQYSYALKSALSSQIDEAAEDEDENKDKDKESTADNSTDSRALQFKNHLVHTRSVSGAAAQEAAAGPAPGARASVDVAGTSQAADVSGTAAVAGTAQAAAGAAAEGSWRVAGAAQTAGGAAAAAVEGADDVRQEQGAKASGGAPSYALARAAAAPDTAVESAKDRSAVGTRRFARAPGSVRPIPQATDSEDAVVQARDFKISAPAFYSSQIQKSHGRSWAVEGRGSTGDAQVDAARIHNTSSYRGPAAAHAAAVRAASKGKLPPLNEELDYRPELYGNDLPDPDAAQKRAPSEGQAKRRASTSDHNHDALGGMNHPDLPYDHSLVYASSDEIDTDIDLQDMADSMQRSSQANTGAAAWGHAGAGVGTKGHAAASAAGHSGPASAGAAADAGRAGGATSDITGTAADARSAGAPAGAGSPGAAAHKGWAGGTGRAAGTASLSGAAGTGADAAFYSKEAATQHSQERYGEELQWTDEFMDAYMSSYGGGEYYENSRKPAAAADNTLKPQVQSRAGMFAGNMRLSDYVQQKTPLEKILEEERRRAPKKRYYNNNNISTIDLDSILTNHEHDSILYSHIPVSTAAENAIRAAHDAANAPDPAAPDTHVGSNRADNLISSSDDIETQAEKLQRLIRKSLGVSDDGTSIYEQAPAVQHSAAAAAPAGSGGTAAASPAGTGGAAAVAPASAYGRKDPDQALGLSSSYGSDGEGQAYVAVQGDRHVLGTEPEQGGHWSEIPALKRARSRSESGVPGMGGPTREQLAMGVYSEGGDDGGLEHDTDPDVHEGEEHEDDTGICEVEVTAPQLQGEGLQVDQEQASGHQGDLSHKAGQSSAAQYAQASGSHTPGSSNSDLPAAHDELSSEIGIKRVSHARVPVTFTRITSYSLRFREDPFLNHGDVQKESSACINGRGYSCYLVGRHYDALASMERNNKRRLQAAEDLAHAHDNYPVTPVPGAVFDHLLHSIVYFRRGCHLKHSLSCRLLLSTYGRYGGIIAMGKTNIANRKLGSRYLETGCNFEEPRSCANLAAMHLNGYAGFEPDTDKGLELYLRSCRIARTITNELRLIDPNLGIGCLELGRIYLNGGSFPDKTVIAPDYVKAHRFLHQACSLRSTTACRLIKASFDDHDEIDSPPRPVTRR